jgi:hypothetical protein
VFDYLIIKSPDNGVHTLSGDYFYLFESLYIKPTTEGIAKVVKFAP